MQPLPAELKRFVQEETWIFAKTYATTWPHEYLVKRKVDEQLFVKMVLYTGQWGLL